MVAYKKNIRCGRLSPPKISGGVYSLSFSFDGRKLLSGGGDQQLKIWDLNKNPSSKVLSRYSFPVTAVFFTHNENIVSAGGDGTIRFQDPDGKENKIIEAHREPLIAMAMKENRFASTDGREIKIWTEDTEEMLTSHQSPPLSSLCLSSNPRFLFSGSLGGVIKIWDTQAKETILSMQGDGGSVFSLSLSPDEKFLISGHYSGFKIWDPEKGEPVITSYEGEGEMPVTVFSHDGNIVGAGMKNGIIRLWNLLTGESKEIFMEEQEPVISLAFSPLDEKIAIGTQQGKIYILDALSGRTIYTLNGHSQNIDEEPLHNLKNTNNGNSLKTKESSISMRLATDSSPKNRENNKPPSIHNTSPPVSMSSLPAKKPNLIENISRGLKSIGSLLTFNREPHIHRSRLPVLREEVMVVKDTHPFLMVNPLPHYRHAFNISDPDDKISSLSFSHQGNRLLSAGRTIKIWQLSGDEIRQTLFPSSPSYTHRALFTEDGKKVISVGADAKIRIWDSSTGELIKTLSGHGDQILALDFLFDGSLILSGGYEPYIKIWDEKSGKILKNISHSQGTVFYLALSPRERHFVSAGEDKTLRIWEFPSGKPTSTLAGHSAPVLFCLYSPDSRHILSCGRDQTIKMWDTFTGEAVRTFIGHRGEVVSLSISSDNKKFASASQDGTVKIWNLNSGECEETLESHPWGVNSVLFSPQGKSLVSCDHHTITYWN